MIFPKQTLRSDAYFEGRGLHSGTPVSVRIFPGSRGIWFRHGGEEFQAIPENVTDTTRCTRLGSVSTIEHLMSAFAGLGITDAEVEVSAAELPGLDGSAMPYVNGLLQAGLEKIGEVDASGPFKRIFVQKDEIKIAVAAGAGHWRYEYDTGERWPNKMCFEALDIQSEFVDAVAPARTFALAEEVPTIIQAGLGQGLDETSCLVLGIEGYKNDVRFHDEPARHKLLDLVGDLYLSGIPTGALSVVAERSGHRANVEAAALLRLSAKEVSG